MFAWEERTESDSDSSIKRYRYSTDWSSNPENSNNFNISNGHFNPAMRYDQATFTVQQATIGNFSTDTSQLLFMQQEALQLTSKIVLEGMLVGEYIFIGSGTLSSPEVGDLRIKYTAFANDQNATLFGEQHETQLRPFSGPKESVLYRAYPGDRDSAIAAMRAEFLTLLWGVRIGGLVMMWLGLSAIVTPLTNLLEGVPLLGNLGRTAISIVAFLIAFILTTITIIISAILNSIVAMIVIFLLIVGGVIFWRNRQQGLKTAVSI